MNFRCVFNKKDSLIVPDELSEDVQERRLSSSGSAANEDVFSGADIPFKLFRDVLIKGARANQVFDIEPASGELADREGYSG